MTRALALVLGAAVLAGCGSTPPPRSDLSAGAAALLQKDTAAMTAAARAGDGSAVQTALATLRRDVAAQRASGGLSAARADRVLAAAAQVAADVPAPVPSPTLSPTPPADGNGKGKDKHPKGDNGGNGGNGD